MLVFDNVRFDRKEETSPQRTIIPSGGGGTVTAKALFAQTSYVLYDYVNQRVASGGQVDAHIKFAFAMTHRDWYKAVDVLFARAKTPF